MGKHSFNYQHLVHVHHLPTSLLHTPNHSDGTAPAHAQSFGDNTTATWTNCGILDRHLGTMSVLVPVSPSETIHPPPPLNHL